MSNKSLFMKGAAVLLFGGQFLFPTRGVCIALDSIAATVGDEVITVGDVITDEKIRIVTAGAEAFQSLPVPGEFSRDALERTINRKLVFREALKFREVETEKERVDALIIFEGKFRDEGEFQRFLREEGLTATDLARRLSMEQIAAAFVEEKIALSVHVAVREAETYYQENKQRFSDRSFVESEAEIREIMGRQKGLRFLDRWIADLRERGKIGYFTTPSSQMSR